jgi:hypothetical protein
MAKTKSKSTSKGKPSNSKNKGVYKTSVKLTAHLKVKPKK